MLVDHRIISNLVSSNLPEVGSSRKTTDGEAANSTAIDNRFVCSNDSPPASLLPTR